MWAVLQNYLVVQTQCYPPFDQLGHEQHVSPCLGQCIHTGVLTWLHFYLYSIRLSHMMLNMLSHVFALVSIRFVTFTKEFIKKKKFTNFSILCRSKTELFVTMRDILLAKIESTTKKIMEKMQGMNETKNSLYLKISINVQKSPS